MGRVSEGRAYGSSPFDEQVLLSGRDGIHVITQSEARSIFGEPRDIESRVFRGFAVASPLVYPPPHDTKVGAQFPGLEILEFPLSGMEDVKYVRVGKEGGECVKYYIDTGTARIICAARPGLSCITAERVLAFLPLSVETFKVVNDLSRRVLLSVAKVGNEYKWSVNPVGPDTPRTKLRIMVGSNEFKGDLGVRVFAAHPGNTARGLRKFYSVLQVLGVDCKTVALIEYPLAYRTVSSAAVIAEHLLGRAAKTVGVLGFGETAHNLIYAMMALPKPPDSFIITAKGKKGFPSVRERIESELREMNIPDYIAQRVRAVETADEVMCAEVVCDLASRYHPLCPQPETLRLFMDISKVGGPKVGFKFDRYYYDALDARGIHPYYTKEYRSAGLDFQHIRNAGRAILYSGNKSVYCALVGSPIIDLEIGRTIMEMEGLL